MLLCNAIVGNYYDENNYNAIPERLLLERRMIMSGNSDSNTIYILFRVITSDKDAAPKGNQGLMISYQAIGSKSEDSGSNENESNKKCHYLVPIYNDYNVFCYWISSKYLKIRKRDFCFTISDFIKEYWKQPAFTQEFANGSDSSSGNSNMVCFGSYSRGDDFLGYNRVINIEKEENVQMVCVNLKYRNKDFIIVENLIESAKALSAPCSIYNGNDTIKEFCMNEEQSLQKESLNSAEIEEREGQVKGFEPGEQEGLAEGASRTEPWEVEKLERAEEEPDQVRVMIDYGSKQAQEEAAPVYMESFSQRDGFDDSGLETEEGRVLSGGEINDAGSCTASLANGNVEENSQLFTVCAETNVSIIQSMDLRPKGSLNSLGVDREEVAITQFPLEQSSRGSGSGLNANGAGCQMKSSPLTLETCITPVIRNFSIGEKSHDDCNFQEPRPKTDVIQRNCLFKSGNSNSFNTCKANNYANSFLPSGMQIGPGTGNIIDQMNKEELILSRIESARRNVGFNYRGEVHSAGGGGGHRFLGGGCIQGVGCGKARVLGGGGGLLVNLGGGNGIGGSHNVGLDNGYNIDLLSKRFNRVIGKADYLLEQLSTNSDVRGGKGGGGRILTDGRRCGGGDDDDDDDVVVINSGKRGRVLGSGGSSSLISSSCSSDHYDVYSGFYINSNGTNKNKTISRSRSSSRGGNNPKMVVLDNVLSVGGHSGLVGQQQHAQPQSILCSVGVGQESMSRGETLRSFDYTRESNLSIVGGNYGGDASSAITDKVQADEAVLQLCDLSGVDADEQESVDQGWCDVDRAEDSGESERTVDFEVGELGSEGRRRRSVIDPELVEIDFYVDGGRLKGSFSILNIILSRWSGIPTVSKL